MSHSSKSGISARNRTSPARESIPVARLDEAQQLQAAAVAGLGYVHNQPQIAFDQLLS